jgi:hypothetical protein
MVATLLQEQDDEWQVADRRYFSAGSMAHIDELGGGETLRPARGDRVEERMTVVKVHQLAGRNRTQARTIRK